MVSKEDFERIDEEYAKRNLKAADEAFGAPKMYVRANVIDQKFPLLTQQEIESISFRFLKHPFRMRKKDARKLEELLIEHQPSRESQIFANHIFPSTLTPKPEDNWLYGQFYKDMVKEKQRDKILFKFGEFVGQLSKEEKVSFTDIVNVLLEFIENNITKKK